jgi:hypothetical protein
MFHNLSLDKRTPIINHRVELKEIELVFTQYCSRDCETCCYWSRSSHSTGLSKVNRGGRRIHLFVKSYQVVDRIFLLYIARWATRARRAFRDAAKKCIAPFQCHKTSVERSPGGRQVDVVADRPLRKVLIR